MTAADGLARETNAGKCMDVMGEIPWLAVVAAILSSIAWTMFMYRMRKGSYRVVGTTPTAMLFKTSVGEFRLDKKNARLQVRQKQGNWTAVDASQIREIDSL